MRPPSPARQSVVGRYISGVARMDKPTRAGWGAALLGAVCLDFFPPLAALELVSGIVLIWTGRRAASLFAILLTLRILASAISIMVTVSGPANPIMVPVATWSVIVVATLLAAMLDRRFDLQA